MDGPRITAARTTTCQALDPHRRLRRQSRACGPAHRRRRHHRPALSPDRRKGVRSQPVLRQAPPDQQDLEDDLAPGTTLSRTRTLRVRHDNVVTGRHSGCGVCRPWNAPHFGLRQDYVVSTFVLIPGAGGAAWYWHRVAPLLRGAGHDTIAVDLPADDENAGLGEYARLVTSAIGGRDDVILIAQSRPWSRPPCRCSAWSSSTR
jgi:hypothetical protein